MKIAVYIGRFQPVHKGHMETIKKALDENDALFIVIGSALSPRTPKNPWTTKEREEFLISAIKEEWSIEPGWADKPNSIFSRISFLAVRDYLYNDYEWVGAVQSAVSLQLATVDPDDLLDSQHEITIYGCEKDDSSYYLSMFPNWKLKKMHLHYMDSEDEETSSTRIREEYFLNWTSKSKEKEIIKKGLNYLVLKDLERWSATLEYGNIKKELEYYNGYKSQWDGSPYIPTFLTVDTVVRASGCILLIKRKFPPGKDLYALPGGFVNPNERLVDAAIRELKEETRLLVSKEQLGSYIKEVGVFDHPRRSLRGRTITFVYSIDLGHTPLPRIKSGSDAKSTIWMPIGDLMRKEENFFEDHHYIIHKAI